MAANHISAVLKQALFTFKCEPEIFHQNLDILKSLVNKTTLKDVNLRPELMEENVWKTPEKAPVTYIEIFQDDNVSIGLFIVKPGMKLPLHNHPHMHGLIKVLAGVIKIKSFSINTPKTCEIRKKSNDPKLISAEGGEEILLDSNGDCCQLSPDKDNLHEIEIGDESAAFLDVLAPPYETVIEGNETRLCHHYEILCEEDGIFTMKEIEMPDWYFTDVVLYSGPKLSM